MDVHSPITEKHRGNINFLATGKAVLREATAVGNRPFVEVKQVKSTSLPLSPVIHFSLSVSHSLVELFQFA